MKKFILIILLLLTTSNYTKAYELKATVSEIENELNQFYRQNYETCSHFNRLRNLIISAEDEYKVILLIKHDKETFDVKDIVLLDETNLHDDKFRGILDNIVSWYNNCRAHSIQTSIPFFKSQNISEYILEYELKNWERSINIKLTEKDIRKISEGKNQVNSSDVSVKKFDIYNNYLYNWTLFGVKLYDKIENVNVIGKFKIHNYKKDNGYDYQCLFASTINDKPLLIPSITDEKGCINANMDIGLEKYVYGFNNDLHYIVEPPKKNDFFSTYIVRYSPLEKRILSITAKKKNETSSVDICVDEGNMIIDSLNENLLTQNNNLIMNKYKFEDTIIYKTLGRIAVGYDPELLYGVSEDEQIKNLGAVYGFDCVKGEFNTHFYFFLTTIYRDLKIYKEFDIIEENKLLDQKIRSEENIKNVLKNDIL